MFTPSSTLSEQTVRILIADLADWAISQNKTFPSRSQAVTAYMKELYDWGDANTSMDGDNPEQYLIASRIVTLQLAIRKW